MSNTVFEILPAAENMWKSAAAEAVRTAIKNDAETAAKMVLEGSTARTGMSAKETLMTAPLTSLFRAETWKRVLAADRELPRVIFEKAQRQVALFPSERLEKGTEAPHPKAIDHRTEQFIQSDTPARLLAGPTPKLSHSEGKYLVQLGEQKTHIEIAKAMDTSLRYVNKVAGKARAKLGTSSTHETFDLYVSNRTLRVAAVAAAKDWHPGKKRKPPVPETSTPAASVLPASSEIAPVAKRPSLETTPAVVQANFS